MDGVEVFTYRQRPIDAEIIKAMIEPELSEPYSVFTYYFYLQNHQDLVYLVQLLGI